MKTPVNTKHSKPHTLTTLKKFYTQYGINLKWIDDKLLLPSIGYFSSEIVSNQFPVHYYRFCFIGRNLTLFIEANTVSKLIAKLSGKYPEILPNQFLSGKAAKV